MRQVDGGKVERTDERLFQGYRAVIFFAVVFRFPVADGDRIVVDFVVGIPAFFKSRQIDERLECRTRLPKRLSGSVELAFLIIDAAGHRFYGAVSVQHHHRAVGDVFAFRVGKNRLPEGAFRRFLNFLVKRGVNVDVVFPFADIGVYFLIDPVGEISAAFEFVVNAGADRHFQRFGLLFRGDDGGVDHVLQYHRCPL